MKQFLFAAMAGGALLGCQSAAEPAPASDEAVLYDTQPPYIFPWMEGPSVLVFSKTADFRHHEGIAGAQLYFAQLSRETGYNFFTTENAAIFNSEDLERFDVVVFNNITGDILSPDQKQAFKSWLLDGGALMALHGAGDALHTSWPWYDQQIIGPEMISHPHDPQFQDARVVNLAPEHPVMAGIPADWIANDEWYTFDSVPQDFGMTALAGLDESTYRPFNDVYGPRDLRMGETPEEHPVIWSHCPGEGRIVYSALGHRYDTYEDTTYRQLLANAFDWVQGEGNEGCPD